MQEQSQHAPYQLDYPHYIRAENSKSKRAYLYWHTPTGIAANGKAVTRFLARKRAEYQRVAKEIEQLQQEAQANEKHA